MKKIFLSLFFVFMTAIWATAKTPWESYLTLPIPERAASVDVLEYSQEPVAENVSGKEHDLRILQDQVLACDRASFRLTYRLITTTDNGLREKLMAILGHTIRTHPEFFLKEMSRLNPDRNMLKSILTISGSEYSDRNYARRYELYMRRMALTDVSGISSGVREFRDACLELIEIY